MKLSASFHNHSKYSKLGHGKNTISEMCDEARKHDIGVFAISDHGSSHPFGILRKNYKKIRAEIDAENQKGDIKVLMGIEANLLSLKGRSDFPNEKQELFDVRLVGFHKANLIHINEFFTFYLPNLFKCKKMIEKNTEAYIECIKKYNIDIITHPNAYIKVNLRRLAQACADNNCYIELNNRHFMFTQQDINDMLATDVLFVVGTDAHKIQDVNSIDVVEKFVKEYNIPTNRIANIGGEIDLKNKYNRRKNVDK